MAYESLSTIIATSPLVDRLLRDNLDRIDVTELSDAGRALLLAWLEREAARGGERVSELQGRAIG